MTLLARRVALPAAWAAAEDKEHWADGNFPPFLMDEVKDATSSAKKQGMSFFAASQRDVGVLRRIAAALLVKSNNDLDSIKAAHFKFVDSDLLMEAGIPFEKTKGDLGIPELDDLHFDIKGVTGKTAIKLTNALCFSEPVEISAKEIADQICVDIKSAGKYPRKDWPSAKLFQGLYKEGKLFKLARINHRFLRT